MSLASRIESFVVRVAQEFNDVRAKLGNLASLTTTDKTSLVAAVNEVQASAMSSSGIDDAQTSTTTTWSSNKIGGLLDLRVRFDAAQTLTTVEQAQARDNIGAAEAAAVGNTDTDFVAIFDAALV